MLGTKLRGRRKWIGAGLIRGRIKFRTGLIFFTGVCRIYFRKIISADFSLYDELQKVKDERNAGYISVSAGFKTDRVELGRLLDWVGQGNWAFIAASSLQDTLLKTFDIELEYLKEA